MKNKNLNELTKLAAEYRFRIGTLETPIQVRIWERIGDDINSSAKFYFTQSHYIHTPVQAGHYVTSSPYSYGVEAALDRAVDTLTSFYENAISEGHAPAEAWLVAAKCFN